MDDEKELERLWIGPKRLLEIAEFLDGIQDPRVIDMITDLQTLAERMGHNHTNGGADGTVAPADSSQS